MIAFFAGSNPRRFIMFLQNGGDLCAHRAGGASTIRFDCALAQTELEAPRLAAKFSLSQYAKFRYCNPAYKLLILW